MYSNIWGNVSIYLRSIYYIYLFIWWHVMLFIDIYNKVFLVSSAGVGVIFYAWNCMNTVKNNVLIRQHLLLYLYYKRMDGTDLIQKGSDWNVGVKPWSLTVKHSSKGFTMTNAISVAFPKILLRCLETGKTELWLMFLNHYWETLTEIFVVLRVCFFLLQNLVLISTS